MVFARVDNYDGFAGKVSNKEFRVQIFQNKKYLVNWHYLANPQETTYKIIKENTSKSRALANSITDSGLLYMLKESYETQLDPRAFDESMPPRNLSLLFL